MRSTLIALVFAVCAPVAVAEETWPPQLPGGEESVTVQTDKFLQPGPTLREGVQIARTPPTVEFRYYPGQTYPGKPWSVWGEGLVVGDVYYSAIGDHLSPMGSGYVYSFQRKTGEFKQIVNVRETLKLPDGHYTPGKIHSQLGLGKDGWLYFSTHRGSTRIGLDPNSHYAGDWIMRHHPERGTTEVVTHAPLKMQSLPMGLLDPENLIWYGGTADGLNQKPPQFLAWDIRNNKLLYSDNQGPYRAAILTKAGKLYFHSQPPGGKDEPQLCRFDPRKPGQPTPISARLGLRAATRETSDGLVYTVDQDEFWVFDTKTETAQSMGPAAVGKQLYTASLALDPQTERYIYYIPGAHGGSSEDHSPLVQFDVKTRTRKVIAFLHPAVYEKTGFILQGTYSVAVSGNGSTVFITWNGNQGTDLNNPPRKIPFNTCGLTVVTIPESERQP